MVNMTYFVNIIAGQNELIVKITLQLVKVHEAPIVYTIFMWRNSSNTLEFHIYVVWILNFNIHYVEICGLVISAKIE